MLLKHMPLLFSLGFLAVACVSPEPFMDEQGVYRVKPKGHETGKPLYRYAERNESGELIQKNDYKDNSSQLNKDYPIMSKPKYTCLVMGIHDNPYKSSKHFYQAIAEVKKQNNQKALSELDEAAKYCEGMEQQTSTHYVRAVALWNMGEKDKAKESLKKFMDLSERPESYGFGQEQLLDIKGVGGFEEYTEKLWLTHKANREAAQLALSGQSETLELNGVEKEERIAKYGANLSVRPGGNTNKFFLLFPTWTYGGPYSRTGKGFGLLLNIPTPYVNISPFYYESEYWGTQWGVNLRVPVFESLMRDLNLEVNGFYSTAAYGKVYSDMFGQTTRVEVTEKGSDWGVGFGGTKRFTSRWGVSAQVNYVDLLSTGHKGKLLGTAYTFYHINQPIALYTGYIADTYQAGVEVLFARIGYDFKNEGVRVSVYNLFF